MSACDHPEGRPGAAVLRVIVTPAAAVVAPTLFHAPEYGLVVSLPIDVLPLKNSTFEIVPSMSLAFADTVIDAGAVYVAPLVGLVTFTLGGVLVPPPPD